MRLDVYYFSCNFLDCCPHLYCGKLKHNISADVSSSGLPQVSLVYLEIEMIQPGKSFLKFSSQTLKMISQVESFRCPDKQVTPEEGWRMMQLKCVSTYHSNDENSLKNYNQNLN